MSKKISLNLIGIISSIMIIMLLTSLVLASESPISEGGIIVSKIDYNLIKALSVLGLGFAAGGGGLGIGMLSRSFIEGIYRNPETIIKMLIWYFVAFALIEAQVLYTLFFVFQIFFVK